MTTSGTFAFTVNRDQVIRDSMLNLGKLDETESPSAQEITDMSFKLNMLVKQWMGKTDFAPGLNVWTRRRGYLFLSSTTGQYSVGPTATGWTSSFVNPNLSAAASAGQNVINVTSATGVVNGYNIGVVLGANALTWFTVTNVIGTAITLSGNLPVAGNIGAEVFCYQTTGTQPLNIETANLRDQSNQDTSLNIMRTVQEYEALPNKADPTNIADPTAIYYEFQLTNSNLFIDCGAANDTTKYLELTYMETIQDLNYGSDNFEYPQEWFLALSWGLAKQAAPMFNTPWTATMEKNFTDALAIAGHKDAEMSAAYYQPGLE